MNLRPSSSTATLIGDVVASRSSPDRAALHRAVKSALRAGLDDVIDAPVLTVGDEFQGSYCSVGAAIDATLAIRLAAEPGVDIRFGIGWGAVTVLDERIQDGPGWWAAREGIEWVADAQRQPALATLRTAFRSAAPDGPDADAINAALMCRDQLLGSIDERSRRLLRGLLAGRTKKELAAVEGISASAVSQRSIRDGLDVLVLASTALREMSGGSG
jgi:hypothetical protein